jgi:hypothetical protein
MKNGVEKKMLFTVEYILLKDTKADESLVYLVKTSQFLSNMHYCVQKRVQLLSFLSINKLIVFLYFLNKGCTVMCFFYLFLSELLISLNF